MCHRSSSSAKEVHRGRQLKRIGRQPLQSSSSSAAAAAGAVAAAGAETSNEEQFHYRQSVLVAIGLVSTRTWERLVGKTEAGF